MIVFLLLFLIFWIVSEIIRVKYNVYTPTASLIKNFSRSTMEKNGLEKSWKRLRFPFWIVGLITVVIFFNNIAIQAAIITLAFGDTASATTKSVLNNHRLLFGYGIASVVSSFIIVLITKNIIYSVLPAIAGMSGEFIISGVDDNLLIPILAGVGSVISQIISIVHF